MKKHVNDLNVLQEAMSQMQEELAGYRQSLQSLREERNGDEEKHRQQLKDERELFLNKIAEMKNDHSEQISQLESRHRDEMKNLKEELEDRHQKQMDELRQKLRPGSQEEIESLKSTLETEHKTIADLQQANADLQQANAGLAAALTNARDSEKSSRGKRFSPTTEQRNLLNNRRSDRRADDKDSFDGNPPAGGKDAGDGGASASERKKKKSKGRRPSKEVYDCDRVEYHKLDEYFDLPKGACFKTRDGKTEIHRYEYYEFVPGHIVKHVYETATYIDALGVCHNTLPDEERESCVKGCPFSADMLAFILYEKYVCHTSKNQIKHKLRDMGAKFSKSTFVHYYQLTEKALRDMLEPAFKKAALDCSYLMIDETCELVAVIDPDTKIPEYKKRYLWAFYNKASGLVYYLYEDGSRARDVVLKALEGFKGSITTDGYNVYLVFDDVTKHPQILHCGCWAHVRRKFVEALHVAEDICYRFIDWIGDLFQYENLFRNMDPLQTKINRQKLSLRVLNDIFDAAATVAKDASLMGRDLLRKAINYLRSQEQTLRNFILDGNVEISNNGCERRFKPVKLDLKVCQNIGSEDAAKNAAFMHSLIESCRLKNINPFGYLKKTIARLKDPPPDDEAKLALLPGFA